MSEIETPRGPGAPKGRPKPAKSGRKPGSKNKRTVLGQDFVRSLLPAAKRRLRALVEGTNDDLALKACIKIVEYTFGRPVETRHVGGDPDGVPIRREILKTSSLEPDRELARRLKLALDLGEAVPDEDDSPSNGLIPGLHTKNGAARFSEPPAEANGERLEVGTEISLPDKATATVIATQSAGVGTYWRDEAD